MNILKTSLLLAALTALLVVAGGALGGQTGIIATDAGNTNIYASDSLTKVATDSSRSSKFDFLCALIAAIKENTGSSYNLLPLEFELTDRAVAEIMNCTLDLGVEELVDSAYIKRARQRLRDKQTVNA